MLTIKYQTAFKKDYKRIKKRGYDTCLLKRVIELLAEGAGTSQGVQGPRIERRL